MEAFLASLYFFGGFAYLESPPAPPPNWYYALDRTDIRNPYGIIGFGVEHEFNSRWSVMLEAHHESAAPTTNDHGQNSVRLLVKWRPFK